jgi:integrase/recombinase XerD
MQEGIYKTDQRIDGAERRLEFSNLSDRNVEVLKEFKRELLAENVSGHRVNAIFQSFNTISHLIDFDLQEASREEVMDLVTTINRNQINEKDYSVWSLCEYKKAIKRFYQWHTGREKPRIVDFVSTHPKESEKPLADPEELLEVRMVEKWINSCSNPRDKALFGLLWDSGARIGELLSLKWRDIQFKQDMMSVHLREGKNGPRKIFLVESIPLVKKWKSEFPGRAGPDNPVWIALRQGGREEKRQMTYGAVSNQISRLRKEVELPNQIKTNPHAWRKARATDLAGKGMSQANLELWFGWSPGSDKAKFYIFLSQQDLEGAFRRMYPGLDDPVDDSQKFLGENIPEYGQKDLRVYQEKGSDPLG